MSAEPPPTYNTSIFNQAYWGISTAGTLDDRYLQFPTGQGTETLPALVVTGQAKIQSAYLIADGLNSSFNSRASYASANNAFFGLNCGTAIIDGGSNTGMGNFNTLNQLTSGSANSALGAGSLQSITTTDNNTGLGYNSGISSTGANNTFIGASANTTLAGASQCTALGYLASVGANNATALGHASIASGANSTAVGHNSTAGFARSTAIGYNSAATAADQIMLGSVNQSVIIPNQIAFSYSAVPTLSTTSLGYIINGVITTASLTAGVTSNISSISLTAGIWCISYAVLYTAIQSTTSDCFIDLNSSSTGVLTQNTGSSYATAQGPRNFGPFCYILSTPAITLTLRGQPSTTTTVIPGIYSYIRAVRIA